MHGLQPRAAARANFALPAVDLQRHRRLVGQRLADHLLVVVERPAEHLVHRLAQAHDLVVVERVALLERRELGRPQDLVDPAPADPGDRALVP